MVVAGALVSGLLVATPAYAAEDLESRVESALAAVPSEYALFEDLAGSGTASRSSGDVLADIPDVAADGIGLTSDLGQELTIGLPFADAASDRVDLNGGGAAYDNGNGSVTVPLRKTDGSVQIATVIENAQAPSEYRYELGVPAGSRIEQTEGGALIVWSEADTPLGIVAEPWAVDAAGNNVATHYSVDGTALIQTVDHSEGTLYPVVADPWLGQDLFAATYKNRNGLHAGAIVISSLMGPFGYSIYLSSSAGFSILLTAGWSELKTKQPDVTSKATLQQQFNCHVKYGYAIWASGVHWDYEKSRPNNSNWDSNAMSHKCNWNQ